MTKANKVFAALAIPVFGVFAYYVYQWVQGTYPLQWAGRAIVGVAVVGALLVLVGVGIISYRSDENA